MPHASDTGATERLLNETFEEELKGREARALPELAALRADASSDAALRSLTRFFHWLAGSAAIVGHDVLGHLGAICQWAGEMALRHPERRQDVLEMLQEGMTAVARVAKPKPGEASPTPPAVQAAGGDLAGLARILIVDDDPVGRVLAEQVLSAAGFEVQTCERSDQALGVIEAELPDLVILDRVMPNVDGDSICQLVRRHAQPLVRLTPIILVSAQSRVPERVKGLEAGANDYLTKPFSPTELTARVRALLEREAALRHMAVRDGLTGCYNHRYFQNRIQQEVARAERYSEPLGVAILDIDRFKWVNDTFGHQFGDQVLARLGRLMTEMLRGTDVVARYGGEEFGLLLMKVTPAELSSVLGRLRESVLRTDLGGTPNSPKPESTPRISVSIGATSFVKGDTAAALLRRADRALYMAKGEGRNLVRMLGGDE